MAATTAATDLLVEGPPEAAVTVVLAHGAGAPMDTPFMSFFAGGLAAAGHRVVRFEFPYMAARRHGGPKRPPNPQAVLLDSWRRVIESQPRERLFVGGKSLGGRMATMIADETGAAGCICLGYPFHPPGRSDVLRTDHLAQLRTPTLILQGTADPFGRRDEVRALCLSQAIRLAWLPDGDHNFRPPARSPASEQQNMENALTAVVAFVDGYAPSA